MMIIQMQQPVTDWHRAKIRAELEMRGHSFRSLSREAGLKPDSLRNALDRRCPKYERIIAGAIGVPPATIWPSRYAACAA